MFIDNEFPNLPKGSQNLEASPKELGLSRADLWAFAGLIALDEIQLKTKAYCDIDEYGYTCDQVQCFRPFHGSRFRNMFQTGRVDCQPKSDDPNHQYLTGQTEVHPNKNGNGKDTVNFFQEHFGLGPRAGLALMGVHTIGQFNPMTAHVDYAWVRDRGARNELFNNEYYQMMSLKPSKIKTGLCTGTMGKDSSPLIF